MLKLKTMQTQLQDKLKGKQDNRLDKPADSSNASKGNSKGNPNSDKANPTQLAKQFAALADKSRLTIMQLIINQPEVCVSELADQLDMSVSGAWQHLKILESAGLITEYKLGRKTCHKLTDNPQNQPIIELIK